MSKSAVARFVARRLAAAALLLLAISFGTFVLLNLAPGNIVDTLLAGRPRTPALVRQLDAQYHLTGSVFARYGAWLAGAVHLQFGPSVTYGQPVSQVIRQAAPVTLELAGLAFLFVMVIGLPLGVLAAVRTGGTLDRAIVGSTTLGVAVPPFVTGIILIYVFAVTLNWLPAFGAASGAGRFTHLLLPAVALAGTALAIVVKMTRSAMVRELDQDYVVFARARGVRNLTVVNRHALRNALIPVVTAGGLILGYMVTGAVLVEQVFSLPGLGSLLVSTSNARDLPTLQGVVLVFAVVIVLLNLFTDLLYLFIDPRVRLGAAGR